MAEYTEREAVAKYLFDVWKANLPEDLETASFSKSYCGGVKTAIDIISNFPAADVVPVVRCKDCKHLSVRSDALGVYQCAIHGDYPSGEYFCADGERKGGDDYAK